MSFELVVFNKDIYNLLTTRTITTYNTVKYGLYTNEIMVMQGARTHL